MLNASRLRIPVVIALVLIGMSAAPPLAAQTVNGDLVDVGTVTTYAVEKGDTVASIARHFDIGAVELLAANPTLASAKPAVGAPLTIPQTHIFPVAPRDGIVVNLAELRLFYFRADGSVMTFPISIGREGWQTPTGATTVVLKRKNPTWTPPPAIRAEDPTLPAVVPAGPNNPLGQYALSLGWPGYLIHGTTQPSSIGKPASHGCMRMYPEDIAILFNAVEEGTPVTVVDTPVKIGWTDHRLFLEVTPTQVQSRAIAARRPPADEILWDAQTLLAAEEARGVVIDWTAVNAALLRHDGIPVVVATDGSASVAGEPKTSDQVPANMD